MRSEHDLLGTREVPDEAYYGVHTARAVENFPISGTTVGAYPELVRALAAVKEAAAIANHAVGGLDPARAEAIVAACREIRAGALHEHFVVDAMQGGAGTSTNMNANEVVANRALELMGARRGQYELLHPIEDVNRSQSTNDAYPTAVKVAVHEAADDLLAAMTVLRQACTRKAEQYADVVKIGRTQLQEAVPMTLGQELGTYATMIGQDEERLRAAVVGLREVNLGGTAIGTGLTAPTGYAELVVPTLAGLTGIDLTPASDRIEATQGTGAFVAVSGALKAMALRLSKISNDLRLLSSGPQAGFAEIRLPAVQAGSSIMPGKVNPVIPEVVNQVAFAVVGRDVTVSMAAEGGQLQLNAFEPVIAMSLLDSLRQLAAAYRVLAQRCVDGITVNRAGLQHAVEHSVGLVTALVPHIGYERATQLATSLGSDGPNVLRRLQDQGLVPADWQQALLTPTRAS